MTFEAREVLVPSEDGSEQQSADPNSYLTPLQKSLVYELTTRRARIAAAKSRAEFWQKRQAASQKDTFQLDVLDDGFFDRNIKIAKEELQRLKESKLLKEAIIQS